MSTGQEQQIILLWIDAFVWDRVPECLVLFKFAIGSHCIGLCAQLPKNDARQQTRIGLTYVPCFGAERDLHACFNKMFPGNRNLCGIEVSIRKRDDHLFCHSVLSSSCPFTWVLLIDHMLIGSASYTRCSAICGLSGPACRAFDLTAAPLGPEAQPDTASAAPHPQCPPPVPG